MTCVEVDFICDAPVTMVRATPSMLLLLQTGARFRKPLAGAHRHGLAAESVKDE
jgi:hypothetical protein